MRLLPTVQFCWFNAVTHPSKFVAASSLLRAQLVHHHRFTPLRFGRLLHAAHATTGYAHAGCTTLRSAVTVMRLPCTPARHTTGSLPVRYHCARWLPTGLRYRTVLPAALPRLPPRVRFAFPATTTIPLPTCHALLFAATGWFYYRAAAFLPVLYLRWFTRAVTFEFAVRRCCLLDSITFFCALKHCATMRVRRFTTWFASGGSRTDITVLPTTFDSRLRSTTISLILLVALPHTRYPPPT